MEDGRQLTLYIYNPDEEALRSSLHSLPPTCGICASLSQDASRGFLGDAVFKLVVTIGTGVTTKVLADLLLDWFKKIRHTKIIHDGDEVKVEHIEIVRIVKPLTGPPE